VFVREAEELLRERLTLPELKQGETKFKIIEGEISQETIDAIKEKNA
jgi:hypothetical protein